MTVLFDDYFMLMSRGFLMRFHDLHFFRVLW